MSERGATVPGVTEQLPHMPPKQGILLGIQLLRGLAAAMVVVCHGVMLMALPEFFGSMPFPIIDLGSFGVCVFFVVSGFIIAYVTLDARYQPKLDLRDFAWRRFIRIIPFMWVCVIGYNVLSYVGTQRVEWLPMIRALVLFPVGELKPNVLWSLVHELIFYTLFAVALLGRHRRMWLLWLWFAAPLLVAGFVDWNGNWPGVESPLLAELTRVFLLGNLNGANLQFGAGFALALLHLRRLPITARRDGVSLGLVTGVAIAIGVAVEIVEIPTGILRSALWTIPAVAIVWLGLISAQADGFMARFAKVLGDASFSIYLVHNPAFLVIFAGAKLLPWALPLQLLYFGFVIFALLAGIVVHYLVEAPLIARLAHGQPIAPWLRLSRAPRTSATDA